MSAPRPILRAVGILAVESFDTLRKKDRQARPTARDCASVSTLRFAAEHPGIDLRSCHNGW